MKVSTVLSTFLASALISQVLGHGYMTTPKGRTTNTFGDEKDQSACDSDQPGEVTEFQAGEEIEVIWTRNNHLGGFIRYSLVPKDSVSKEAFDQNTFFYTCRETNCSLKECNDKFCGDDAGAGDNGITCRSKVKLPDYLEAGDYVLQWVWHSAGSSYGNIGWSTGNFKTCADIRLTTAGSGTKPKCPPFVGGDRVTLTEEGLDDLQRVNQCFYFDNNDLSKEFVKLDEKEGYERYIYGVPKEIETCGGGFVPTSNTSATFADVDPAVVPASVAPSQPASSSKAPRSGTDGGGGGGRGNGGRGHERGGRGGGGGDGGGKGKGDWEFCSANSECSNNCCSKEYSDDGKMKCTPNGC